MISFSTIMPGFGPVGEIFITHAWHSDWRKVQHGDRPLCGAAFEKFDFIIESEEHDRVCNDCVRLADRAEHMHD